MNINRTSSAFSAMQAVVQNKHGTNPSSQSTAVSGMGMSFEQFERLLNSDISLTEKFSRIYGAFGGIINEEALGVSIQAVQNGRMSMAEMYQRVLRRASSINADSADFKAVSSGGALRIALSGGMQPVQSLNGSNRPAPAEIAAQQDRSARYALILGALRAGQRLSPDDFSFLREYFPDTYQLARRAEREVERLEAELRSVRSREEAESILMGAKTAAMSGEVDIILAAAIGRLSREVGTAQFDDSGYDIMSPENEAE